MRDYSFGNFLRELRKRRGLSQYQLGMLVGVSNRAVSKWENGCAKPQSRILYELSDVLGVTVDELLACKYHSTENEKGVFAMKKDELWEKAYQNLLECYKDVLSIEILNRYLSEYAELKNSDMIVYFDLLSQLRALADNNKEHIHIKGVTGASLISFVMKASEINPLKPHYYCPHCHKVEFSKQALCGWDLPAKQCSCGEEMLRDGHNLPFETLRFPLNKNIHFDISVSHNFYQAAKEFIHTYFDSCTIITLTRSECPNLETIVIIKDEVSELSNGQELPFEEYYERLRLYPSITLMITDMFDIFRLLEKETGEVLGNVDFISSEVLKAFIRNDTKGILEFKSDFVREMIDEISPKSFNALIQISGLSHGTGVWFDNARQLIKKGLPVGKCLAYRDDVFNCVQAKLEEKNLSNTGYAYKLMNDTFRGIYARDGVSGEVKQQLMDIGMDDWFLESIGKIKYAFPKAHGVLYVKYALILMWYKINFPSVFQRIIDF